MNIKKIGLTALAGSLVATSAMAGELSLSGGAKLSYTTKSGTIATTDVASGFAMDQEITASGSGELDNGMTISLSHALAASGGSSSDTSELTLDMGDMGSISYNDTDGHYGLAGLEDKMPKAYEEANDGLGTSSTKATMAKMDSGQGFGYAVNVNGLDVSIGWSDGLGATADRSDGGQDTGTSTNSSSSIALTYATDMGLTVFAGSGEEGQSDGKQLDHTTVGATYAYGPVTVGYQANSEEDSDSTVTDADYDTTIYSVAFNVNDNLSLSYGEHITERSSNTVDQEAESIQASYSMGGMSINIKDSEVAGAAHSASNTHETTEVLVTFAF